MAPDFFSGALFVGMLNDLAEKADKGFVDFDTYAKDPEQHQGKVVYEPKTMRIAMDILVDEVHKDIVDYYDDVFPGVKIIVVDECEDEGLFIDVQCEGTFAGMVVEPGKWYVSNYD